MNSDQMPAWQYRIGPDASPWSVPVGGLHLETGHGLSRIAVVDSSDSKVALVLGFPIDLRGASIPGEEVALDLPPEAHPDQVADQIHDRLGGRYVAFVTAGNGCRIYLDCAGQIPCVYDPDTGCAGSSPVVLLSREHYDQRFDERRFTRMGIAGSGWLPAGLTCHAGVHRLLPNFCLDLESMSIRRHWSPSALTTSEDPEAEIASLVTLVRSQIAALVGAGPMLAQALTAGRETRLLLGCARPFLDKIGFVTLAVQGGNTVDTVVSARIAKGEDLQHTLLPVVKSSDDEREAYLRLNGHVIADANADNFPSMRPIARTHVFAGGAGGEIGRGFFWKPDDHPGTELTGSGIVRRFGLAVEPELVEACDTWLAAVGTTDALLTLDLAYLEHRMGAWSGPQFCSDPTLVRYAPLLTKPGIVNLLRLPAEWKRSERLSSAVIDQTWPELNCYPYNSLGALRDALAKLQRVAADPALLLRKIRKLS